MTPIDLTHTLGPDETLLWQGQPNKETFILTKMDWFLVPFSLFWAGFALVWNLSVWTTQAPLMFKLFGLPFLIVGLYITIGRFLGAAHRRSKRQFALTNRRALIIDNGGSIREMPLKPAPQIKANFGKNGGLTLGATSSLLGASQNPWGIWTGESPDFTFSPMANVQEPYTVLQQLLNSKDSSDG